MTLVSNDTEQPDGRADLNGKAPSAEATPHMPPARVSHTLTAHHAVQSDLCAQLEELADSLPDNVDSQLCLYIARSLGPIVHQAHDFEESVLFPLLEAHAAGDAELEATLERLRFEHWEDESFAGEVADGLAGFVTAPQDSNVESLAYMLRGFFEGLRRHIAFEREHLLPMLTRMDIAQ